jgi:hypothetical protein
MNKALIIKQTRRSNFCNLFLDWNSTCFGQFLFSSSGVFHCTHSNGICHTGLLTAYKQLQDVPSWFCMQAVSKTAWRIALLYVQWKTPDDGKRNCPKHVEFQCKNKFEKLLRLVGFIIRIYHDGRSHEWQLNEAIYAYYLGTAVAQWLRCCATNRKVAGSIPDGDIGIFHWHNPSVRTMALGSTQPLTEMSTRRISWG